MSLSYFLNRVDVIYLMYNDLWRVKIIREHVFCPPYRLDIDFLTSIAHMVLQPIIFPFVAAYLFYIIEKIWSRNHIYCARKYATHMYQTKFCKKILSITDEHPCTKKKILRACLIEFWLKKRLWLWSGGDLAVVQGSGEDLAVVQGLQTIEPLWASSHFEKTQQGRI